MRASMIEVLESDYVEMARLKGLPERTVLWRHADAQRHRPDAAGDRAQHRLPRRRASSSSRPCSTTRASGSRCRATRSSTRTCRSCSSSPCSSPPSTVVVNLLADVGTILVTPRLQDERCDDGSSLTPEDSRRAARRSPSPRPRGRAVRTRARAVADPHRPRRSCRARRRRSPSSGRWSRRTAPTEFVGTAEHPQRRGAAVRHRLPRPGRVVAVPATAAARSSSSPLAGDGDRAGRSAS